MRKVVLTREYEDSLKSAKLFEEKGFQVFILPLIRTQGLPFEIVKDHFDYAVFQSKKAVKYFFEKANLPKDTKVVAVGKATKKALEDLGYSAIVPEKESAKGLVELFKSIKPCKVLIPRAKESVDDLVEFLKNNNFTVVDIKVYETVEVEYTEKELTRALSGNPIVVLASPSAVKSLFANLQKNMLICKVNLKDVICIGETTKKAYEEYFGGCCYVPRSPSMEEVVELALSLK